MKKRDGKKVTIAPSATSKGVKTPPISRPNTADVNTRKLSTSFMSPVSNRPTTTPKSDMDFSERVSCVSRIKVNTRKHFDDKFKDIDLGEAEKKLTLLRGTSSSNLHRENSSWTTKASVVSYKFVTDGIKPEDSHVSPFPHVSLFPVSDRKLFPPRNRSTGWKIGLKQTGDLTNQDLELTLNHDSDEDQGESGDVAEALYFPPISPEKSFTAQNSFGLMSMSSMGSFATMNSGVSNTDGDLEEDQKPSRRMSSFGLDELKKRRYAASTLPSLSVEKTRKYFGAEANKAFYSTYKQLRSRGEILQGGFEELSQLVQTSKEENILSQSVQFLEESGVLTPRFSHDFSSLLESPLGGKTQLSNQKPTENPVAEYEFVKDNKCEPSLDNTESMESTGVSSAKPFDENKIMEIKSEEKIPELSKESLGTVGIGEHGISISHSISTVLNDKDTYLNLPHQWRDRGGSIDTASSVESVTTGTQEELGSILSSVVRGSGAEGPEDSYSVGSPRALFLAGCLRENLPPMTAALLRKKLTSTINLAHMGIGNKVAMVFASCLSNLPYLQLLNLTDNNLEDSGLSALIRSISKHKDIAVLDISQNIIGPDAAAALADFMGNKECRLQSLRMSNANIDDGECARFVEVLMNNEHVKELDLSNNLLGKDENLNTVQPDFVTGGESLSELISHGKCPLHTLNLHWNMIRLEGAEVLCESIRTNRTLTRLDLSYNALGRVAAGILGAALLENKVITVLNVANNGIDAVGCFTLFVGARESPSLTTLNIDGNPVGEQGGRILVKTAAAVGSRLGISTKNCDFTMRSSDIKFKINDPFGNYTLNLKNPYERAILLEMLDITVMDSSIQFGSFEYCQYDGGSKDIYQSLKIVKFEEEKKNLSDIDKTEIKILEKLVSVSKRSLQDIIQIVQSHGEYQIAVSTLPSLLRSFHIHKIPDLKSDIEFLLDSAGCGYIDNFEFIEYILQRSERAKQRIRELKFRTSCAAVPLDHTGRYYRYFPPEVGKVRVKILEGYAVGNDDLPSHPASHPNCLHVIKTAEQSSNALSLILYHVESCRLYVEEAYLMYLQIYEKSEEPIMALATVIQRLSNPNDALKLTRAVIRDGDVLKLRRLKQRLGRAADILLGSTSGFYSLELSNPLDRYCLKLLIEQSVKTNEKRRKKQKWDTSQNGNWSNFRNEMFTGPNSEGMSINPKHFCPMPMKGKVEFDFINTKRPNTTFVHAIADEDFIDILLLGRVLHTDKVPWAMKELKYLRKSCRKGFLMNGEPYWKVDMGRALSAGDHLFNIYNNLSNRKNSYQKSFKRENIKSAPVEKVVEKKTKESKGRSKKPKSTIRQSMDMISMQNAAALVEASTSDNVSLSGQSTITTRRSQTIFEVAVLANAKMKEFATILQGSHRRKSYQTHLRETQISAAQQQWSRRLKEVMASGGSDEYKSASLLEYFEFFLCTKWIYCLHLSLILQLIPFSQCSKSSMGSYRVELVLMLFDRLIDLHNFELVLMPLNAEEHACLLARIGILNMFNPCKPEGSYQLDLSRWEERQIAKMLIHLSVVEPGENWLNKEFKFDHGFSPIPGWDLNITWFTENGLPQKGVLSFEMFAGDGMNQLGCLVNKKLRNILMSLVLAEERYLMTEINLGLFLEEKNQQEFEELTQFRQKKVAPRTKILNQQDLFPFLHVHTNPKTSIEQLMDFEHIEDLKLFSVVEDAENHLKAETDILWTYTSGTKPPENWAK